MTYQMPPPPLPGQRPHPPAPAPYPQAMHGCRNCGGPLRSAPLRQRSGRFRLRGTYIILGVLTFGILAVLLWPVWPRKSEQTGVLYTCTACGLQQT